MSIAAQIDDIGKPAWIALTIVGFILFWPMGLALLLFLLWSGRMGGCWRHGRFGRWQQMGADAARRWGGGDGPRWRGESSGNRAFDEYREETLRRLEEEQREFKEFLDRLRFAKDKAEFDEFLAERRRRAQQGGGPEAQPQQG